MNPLLCSYKDFADLALIDLGVTYYHDSKSILFIDGWSQKEAQHRWTNSNKSSIVVNVNKTRSCIPSIDLHGWVLGEQNVEALVDGSVAFIGKVSGDITLKLKGKFNANSDSNIVKVDLVLPNAHSPANGDPRKLGFALKSLKFECVQGSRSAN